MMADLIACLYPYYANIDERDFSYADDVIHSPDNISRLIPKLLEIPKQELPDHQSRESTAPLQDDIKDDTGERKDDQIPDYYYYEDGLQLTFSQSRKGRKGFVFGINRSECDIVLPRLGGIKQCHCYLTFDSQDRLVLQDKSSNGTTVTYNGKGGERRCNFTWILGGHRIPDEDTKLIVIEFHKHLKFQIVVPERETKPKQYIENISRFRANTNNDLAIGRLDVNTSRSTAVASEVHAPNQSRLLITVRTLAKGGFADVTHVWDVSIGEEYACKMPLEKKKFDRRLWEKEIDIMGHIQHVS
jgi:hypothetical protein